MTSSSLSAAAESVERLEKHLEDYAVESPEHVKLHLYIVGEVPSMIKVGQQLRVQLGDTENILKLKQVESSDQVVLLPLGPADAEGKCDFRISLWLM